MKGLGYGLLALGALALLSAVLLPAEFDYQDYADTGAPRRLMLGILGGVVFIGGTILVAAQSILDGLRRTPVAGPAPAPAPPAPAAPISGKANDWSNPAGSAGIQRDSSGGNALLISGVVIVALIAVLAVIALAILIMRQQQESDSYDDAEFGANSVFADPASYRGNDTWWTRGEWVETEPERYSLPPSRRGKVVPGLDRQAEPAPEAKAPEAARREAPARRAAPTTREDPFADPPAASDDPFAD
ncbi:hypothetical protein TPR58_20390 [Sphingomonas sp. HF-S3]|uniref:Uncharacterized protein n=1 Tax=Sphingomonas rustica TaxID=3103142 RepID=A0ABV0BDB6_9SPHN